MNNAGGGGANQLPLAGIRVLDLTLARAGPTCVRHLADWGADVVAIRHPDSRNELIAGAGSDYENLHRNKRLIRLDLKTPLGLETFRRLAADADVVVENMRPPVKARLKIAYDDLRAINPRLVYGSISGFGQDGPYAARAGVDQIAQGMGGLMSVTGEPGGPPMRAGIAVSDMAAGTLLALAVMMALYQRESTGLGRYVHTSLLESQIFMMDFQAARWLIAGENPGPVGNDHPTVAAMGAFPTADGHVNIAASGQAQFARFCEAAGRPEWPADPRWATSAERTKRRTELNAAIAEETRKHPTAWWVERLEAAGIPCGPILRVDEMFADPQVKHLGMAAPLDHPTLGPTHLIASPLNFKGLGKPVRSAAPGADETEAVLGELGFEAAEIALLREQGVIGAN